MVFNLLSKFKKNLETLIKVFSSSLIQLDFAFILINTLTY